MIMSTRVNNTKVIISARASYLHAFEPDSINGSDPKYSVSLIIDKKDTDLIAKIKKAVEQAKEDGKSKWGGKIPANLKLPLRDGDLDRPEDEAYAGAYFINANSKQAPQVVDRNVQPILDQSELYSITIYKNTVLSRSYFKSTISCRCYSCIFFMNCFHSGIPFGILITNFSRTVWRSVIDQNNFQIFICLCYY